MSSPTAAKGSRRGTSCPTRRRTDTRSLGRASRLTSTGMDHPRVEQTIEQIGEHVHADHDESDEEESPLGERVVPRLHGLDEQAAEPGPAEDRLDDHVARDRIAD